MRLSVNRLGREHRLREMIAEEARGMLERLASEWLEVEPTYEIRQLTALVSRPHPLKAADALQLAAALRWCEGNTAGVGFVCLDNQLRRASLAEGFDALSEGAF